MISTPLVEGFDEVYKRNYTRLSQYAFHIIHDKGDAEDLANEAFLVYYQHADEMDIENPDAYLFKILRNLIGNYIKRRDLHPTLSLDILEETADIQSSPEPLEYLLPQGLSQDERDILILCLKHLRQKQSIRLFSPHGIPVGISARRSIAEFFWTPQKFGRSTATASPSTASPFTDLQLL